MYKILLVDDEELVLKSLAHAVEWDKHGFQIIDVARSAREAYEKIQKNQPDIIFTDIQMPGMNGLELIGIVRKEYPGIRFIILSGYAEFAYAKKALELGAVGYCLKPFQSSEIIHYLERMKKEFDESGIKNKETAIKEIEPAEKLKDSMERKEKVNQTYQLIKEYIDQHYAEDVSPQEMATRFHVNTSYLSQLFKRESGITYTQYVMNLRIKHACRLLSTTDLKVADISEKTGFNDYFYFTRVFKKIMNVSPSEFRGRDE